MLAVLVTRLTVTRNRQMILQGVCAQMHHVSNSCDFLSTLFFDIFAIRAEAVERGEDPDAAEAAYMASLEPQQVSHYAYMYR